MVRSYEITKIFRSGHDCASAFFFFLQEAFRLQAENTIWVLRKVRENTVLTRTRFYCCSRLQMAVHEMTWKFLDFIALGGFPRGSVEVLSSTKFSLNSCQSGNSCEKSLCTSSDSSFLFLFSVSVDSCSGSPESLHSYFHFFGYWIFGVSVDIKYRIL